MSVFLICLVVALGLFVIFGIFASFGKSDKADKGGKRRPNSEGLANPDHWKDADARLLREVNALLESEEASRPAGKYNRRQSVSTSSPSSTSSDRKRGATADCDEVEVDVTCVNSDVEFLNPEGSCFIAGASYHCQPGLCVVGLGVITPDPENEHDPNAQAVYLVTGKLVGFVPRDYQGWLKQWRSRAGLRSPQTLVALYIFPNGSQFKTCVRPIPPKSPQYMQRSLDDFVKWALKKAPAGCSPQVIDFSLSPEE